MARRFSSAWMQALSEVRPERAWINEYGPRVPTLPWVTTPLPPLLRDLFQEYGRKVTLSGGERLFSDTMVKWYRFFGHIGVQTHANYEGNQTARL